MYADFDEWKEELKRAFGDVGRAEDEARKGGPPQAVEAALARREEVTKKGESWPCSS